ncbi:MAG TPA: hypothetical protein VFT43_00365 [Candidatus Polarisedimenticolia bacterium]|nr:hypothetical protein [Candidatus Polarisedimenticolia bacterium]
MRLRVLGVLSLALFWVPIWAPLIHLATLVLVLHAAWQGAADRLSVAIGAGGMAAGFALFLALQYLWIV